MPADVIVGTCLFAALALVAAVAGKFDCENVGYCERLLL